MPFTQADLDWAAQTFRDAEADRELEEQALEAAWYDQFNASLPVPADGRCLNCGQAGDALDMHGLCPACEALADDATIACRNWVAGLGNRVF